MKWTLSNQTYGEGLLVSVNKLGCEEKKKQLCADIFSQPSRGSSTPRDCQRTMFFPPNLLKKTPKNCIWQKLCSAPLNSLFSASLMTGWMMQNMNECNSSQSQFTSVRVPLLCSFLLLPPFPVASTKPAALHGLRGLPASCRGVLLLTRGRYDLPRAAVNLLWLQRGGQAEDGILGSGDAQGGNPGQKMFPAHILVPGR